MTMMRDSIEITGRMPRAHLCRASGARARSTGLVTSLVPILLTGLAVALTACSAGPIGGATQTGALGSAAPMSADGAAAAKPASVRGQAKVAVLLPLTGDPQTAAISKGLKQAAELALFDFDNPTVQLMVKDDKGTPQGAMAAADEAVRGGAELVVGPLFSRSVAAAAPVARKSNIPVVAFSNDRAVAGNGVYLLSYHAEPEVDRVVGYATRQGKRGFAALLPGDAYGTAVEATFRAAVSRHGGTVVALERYTPDSNAMLEATKRVGAAIQSAEASGQPADALFIPGGEDIIPRLGSLLGYAGIDSAKIKLLGTGGWDYPNVGRDAALVGAWYAGPDPRGWQAFTERFSKTYGAPPPRLAALAYDAVGIAIALSSRPAGQRYTAETLTASSGFDGVDGHVRLLPGGLIERSLAILEVQKFGVSVAEPAASTPPPASPAPVAYAPPVADPAFRPLASAPPPPMREILPETN